MILIPVGGLKPCLAQSNPERVLQADFYPEQGCPVGLTSVRSVLEIDPFGAPTASKIYLTYQNNSSKPVAAVKFRCRFSDSANKDRGTFHAPDAYPLSPGASRSHKWKREGGLSPNIASFQIRVLQVKYSDGSMWESIKMQELSNGEQPDGGSFGSSTEQSVQAPGGQADMSGGQPAYQQYDEQTQQPPAQIQQQPPYEQTPPPQQSDAYDKSKELPW
ncbi:hypothetical protein KF728_00685 [Candidatus Obscuribacterales bacterium]|nr:hypothetical protein [Candidatus Obscuribacterales bacterium]